MLSDKTERNNWLTLDAVMQKGIDDRVFPGAVILVWLKDEIVFHEAYGNIDTGNTNISAHPRILFDLASLTKPLATTLVLIELVSQGKLSLDDSLESVFQGSKEVLGDKGRITIRHLLSHTSGLPAYKPYYKILVQVKENYRKKELFKLLMNESLESAPGENSCYSDLGFMLLQLVVEELTGQSLAKLCREMYTFFGIDTLLFSPKQVEIDSVVEYQCASTGMCWWRVRKLSGEVHDENAYVLGGVAGHAGLFGTALDVCKLLSNLHDVYIGKQRIEMLDPDVIGIFWSRQENLGDGNWALGFDIPSKAASSAGNYFSDNSIGHLGFTGTSFWFDLDRRLIVILLTNRVYYGRENEKIRSFRPVVHDEVIRCLRL